MEKPAQQSGGRPSVPGSSLIRPVLILTLLFSILLGWGLYRRARFARSLEPIGGLMPVVFKPLPLGSIKPRGWLLDQLKLQAAGLTGHLDEFWPDVKESGWIGGKAEGWERAPYWLDGLVPMAYLTGDIRLQKKAGRWMDYILRHQLRDGWLGPEKSPPPYGFHFAPPESEGIPGRNSSSSRPWPNMGKPPGTQGSFRPMEQSLWNLDDQLNHRRLWPGIISGGATCW